MQAKSGLWFSWLLGVGVLHQEKAVKLQIMTGLNIGRNEHHLSSFSSSIILCVYIRMSLQNQRERTGITRDSASFQKQSFNILVPKCEGYHDKASSSSVFLSIIGLVTYHTNVLPHLMMWLYMDVPFLSPFAFLSGSWPELNCFAYSSLSMKYWNMLLIPWFRYFYNLSFLFSSNCIFSNPSIMWLFS